MQEHESSVDERAGARIDRYTLVEEIGQGGMGAVWRAEQSEPIKREVALKIIKLGMDTKEVVARFDAERQALALMDHPHIARVVDGGSTRSGRPYFAMELVRGEPITSYCDGNRLGLGERLDLFIKVCQAIQHAHQKGIIHRDIKPSNVMVTEHDGEPVPKVIDFGIAKATHVELTEQTLTQHAQIVGTPEYMAPEQAERTSVDIDTRADVYALGALLYELLTGTKPFNLATTLGEGYSELLRTIREVEPAKPSTRVSSLGSDASETAASRRVALDDLQKHLRGDLDWIVMKALEKDRSRRYETANGFAADVGRFLAGEPVEAAPPSATYRLKKLLVRRKKTVASVAAIVFLLVVGSIGTGVGWWRTVQAKAELGVALVEKDRALAEEADQRELAEVNADRARAAEAEARSEAERASRAERDALQEAQRASLAEAEAAQRAAELELVASFQAEQLSDLDVGLMGARLRDSLIAATPEDGRAALVTSLGEVNFTDIALQSLRENVFDRTIEAIDTQFRDQPLVRARLLQTLSTTLKTLGLLEAASDPQERSLAIRREELGEQHFDTLSSMTAMARLLQMQGRADESEPYARSALEGLRIVKGPEDESTILATSGVGVALYYQGRYKESGPYMREAVETARNVLGDDHETTLLVMSNLAGQLGAEGQIDQSESVFREVLERRRRTLGEEHPSTLASINAMGIVLQAHGRLAEAEPYVLEILDIRRRIHGDDHYATLVAVNNLGRLLHRQGNAQEAETLYREALGRARPVLGERSPLTLRLIHNVGEALHDQGQLAEAEPWLREALAGRARVLDLEHVETGATKSALAQLLTDRVAAARAAGDEVDLAHRLADRGAFLLWSGSPSEALPVLTEARELLHRGDALDPRVRGVIGDLGEALVHAGRHTEAEPLLLESAELWLDDPSLGGVPHAPFPGASDPTAGALERVIALYEAWQTAESDAGYRAQAEDWRSRLGAWRAGE